MKRTKQLNKLKKLEKSKRIKKQKRMAKVKNMQTAEKHQKDHNFFWEYVFKLATGQIDKEIEKCLVMLDQDGSMMDLELLRFWAKVQWENYVYVKTYRLFDMVEQDRPKYQVKKLEELYKNIGFSNCKKQPYLMLIVIFLFDYLIEGLKKQ